MRFIVDGYNVTQTDPATQRLPAEEQRAALVRRLAARGRDLLGEGPITIVWDGRPDGRGVLSGPVEECFSGDTTADEVIGAATRDGDVVVTSDREVAAASRGRGADVRPAAVLFDATRPPRRRNRKRVRADVGLPAGANRITEELKRVWLQDGD